MVKTIYTLILILLTSFCSQAQKHKAWFINGSEEFQQWEFEDFIKNDVRKMEVFSYKVRKNGKASGKRILLSRQELDSHANKISGISCHTVFVTHAPAYLSFFKFETIYNKRGQVLYDMKEPLEIEKQTEYGSTKYEVTSHGKEYAYDKEGKLLKEVYIELRNSYSISKHTKDTDHYSTVYPRIYEYHYNTQGQLIARYYTDDSTRYLPASHKPGLNSAYCNGCSPRHLNDDRIYYDNGKLKLWTSYTRQGEIHTKRYYFYDSCFNLSKRIDSTGWYQMKYSKDYPELESVTGFEYQDTLLSKSVTDYGGRKNLHEYDSSRNLVKSCSIIETIDKVDSIESCTDYHYTFENGKPLSITSINRNRKEETRYSYNTKGLLWQKEELQNNILLHLTRYFYE
jgi:hypothetical protein